MALEPREARESQHWHSDKICKVLFLGSDLWAQNVERLLKRDDDREAADAGCDAKMAGTGRR